MRSKFAIGLVALGMFLLVGGHPPVPAGATKVIAAPPPPATPDLTPRVQALELQVAALQNELAELKKPKTLPVVKQSLTTASCASGSCSTGFVRRGLFGRRR